MAITIRKIFMTFSISSMASLALLGTIQPISRVCSRKCSKKCIGKRLLALLSFKSIAWNRSKRIDFTVV